MKKLFFAFTAFTLLLVCCTKDPSVNNAHYPSTIAVTYASDNMLVSATSFTASDWLNVDFTETADSIEWHVSDTTINPYDTIPYYPPTDTLHYPGDTSHYPNDTAQIPPTDTTHYPQDTTQYPPVDSSHYPGDSTGYPHDTIPNYPHDTIPHNDSIPYNINGCNIQVHGDNLKIQVTKQGGYIIEARAYRRNANGSYTLIKTGYVKLSAR